MNHACDRAELLQLWHISRTALAAQNDASRYDRLCWVAEQYHRTHPNTKAVTAYIAAINAVS